MGNVEGMIEIKWCGESKIGDWEWGYASTRVGFMSWECVVVLTDGDLSSLIYIENHSLSLSLFYE